MAYVIQASPISKLFMPEWSQKCIDNPDLLLDDTLEFKVRVPRSAGAIVLTHNKPVHASSLIPVTGRRELDMDEVRPLIPWLTGGPDGNLNEETDIYGVVSLDLAEDMTAGITEILSFEAMMGATGDDNPDRLEQIIADQQKRMRKMLDSMRDAIVNAKKQANDRVKRAMRVTHSNLRVEWARLEQEGKAAYEPSVAEALGAFILNEEIKKQSEQTQKIHATMKDAMSSMFTIRR